MKPDEGSGAAVIEGSREEAVVAYHEAGHAVAAHRLMIPFYGRTPISIIPSEEYTGVVFHRNILPQSIEWDASDRSRLKMERVVQVCLAGIEAQYQFDPASIRRGELPGDWDGGDDYHQAIGVIDYFTGGNEETSAYLELLRLRAQGLVRNNLNWHCITAVAEALQNKKKLSAKQLREVIAKAKEDFFATSLRARAAIQVQ